MSASRSLRGAVALLAAVFPALGALCISALKLPVLCGIRRLIGVPCPGCGLTRSISALARLDLAASFRFHPLGPLFALYLGSIWVTAWWSYFVRGSLVSPVATRLPGLVHLSLFALLIAVWLVRFTGLLGGPAAPVDLRLGLLSSLLSLR